LKGDVLSYFTDPAELYFPNNHIDLRYGIQASLLDTKNKETNAFTVTTDQRKYYFRADSATSAKEWVKALQKVIFRTHNDGDSVKISIPVENMIEIEESPVLEFADTIKLKVFDNDDTYAIDEVGRIFVMVLPVVWLTLFSISSHSLASAMML
jgi:sterol 3beta-glucosyltransferase